MNKKTIVKILIGVVILAGVSYGAGVYIDNTTKEINNLTQILNEAETKIDLIEGENKILQEENSSIKNEKELLEKEIEEIQGKYERLNEKYQKEVSPVSFQDWNLHSPSNGTVGKLERGLKGTGLEGLGSWYLEAEQTYGVNAIFLMALTAQESAWGTSNRARSQNNLSGYAVYSSAAEGAYFSSKGESIMATAKLIGEKYINPNGEYYNGVSVASVNIRYCPDDGGHWSSNITKIAYQLVSKINSQ